MHSRAIPMLSYSCVAVFAAYIAFVVATIYFASFQTTLSASVREAESRVAALETEYYDAISRLNAIDATALGFIAPSRVEYVALDGREPTFTRADQ